MQRRGKHWAELVGSSWVEERTGAITEDVIGEDHPLWRHGLVRVLESPPEFGE